ncbi:hypothetical protein GQ600_3242 [Phytophthora cactorum]|nr:hypothetical protein GQ600_3242 [Phytophthora cactorum]
MARTDQVRVVLPEMKARTALLDWMSLDPPPAATTPCNAAPAPPDAVMRYAGAKPPPKDVAAALVSADSAEAKEAAGSDISAAAAAPGPRMPPAPAKSTVPRRLRPAAKATLSTSPAEPDERPRSESKRKAPTSSSSTKRSRTAMPTIRMRKYYRTKFLGIVDLAIVHTFIIHKTVMRQRGKRYTNHMQHLCDGCIPTC